MTTKKLRGTYAEITRIRFRDQTALCRPLPKTGAPDFDVIAQVGARGNKVAIRVLETRVMKLKQLTRLDIRRLGYFVPENFESNWYRRFRAYGKNPWIYLVDFH